VEEVKVQNILCCWFKHQGYSVECCEELESGNKIDLRAKSGCEEWLVEVKGDYDRKVSQYQTNFDTGMGQLLKSITRLDDRIKYAIAIPINSTERKEKFSYRLILPKYSKSLVFEVLNIHLILVRDDKSVEVIAPCKVKEVLCKIKGEKTTGST